MLLDHVTKSKDTRGRYSIGGQHKLAAIDGASYVLENIMPFGRGMKGMSKISVVKDKNGWVRKGSVLGKAVGELLVHANDDGSYVHVRIATPEGLDTPGEFWPTTLMQRISDWIEGQKPRIPNTGDILRNVQGNNKAKSEALNILAKEGYLHRQQDGAAVTFALLKPFPGGRENQ
ncbi:hypothetical protein [Blastococcus sp. VKM Ac-2987]|uniref:hypothetical protein n=1 Tax=Blastococcus sp. VKM Ac-2987 TaxID=3004141 RepID=UPI0022ABBB69|nr:hypothetical protein [Blastococcus sp. VKM Ac-2987]MCZ2857420.1 hypothetical protein [Blastococcus sp. VKM Ac-2987]